MCSIHVILGSDGDMTRAANSVTWATAMLPQVRGVMTWTQGSMTWVVATVRDNLTLQKCYDMGGSCNYDMDQGSMTWAGLSISPTVSIILIRTGYPLPKSWPWWLFNPAYTLPLFSFQTIALVDNHTITRCHQSYTHHVLLSLHFLLFLPLPRS